MKPTKHQWAIYFFVVFIATLILQNKPSTYAKASPITVKEEGDSKTSKKTKNKNLPNSPSVNYWKSSRGLSKLNNLKSEMPSELREITSELIEEIKYKYNELSKHQINLLNNEAMFTGVILSKKHNPKRYELIHDIFKNQFQYVRDKYKNSSMGYAFFVNAASEKYGGQRGYLLNFKDETILEVYVSTSKKGFGFVVDSGKTPLGYFEINEERATSWDNKTILGDASDMFRKLKYKNWQSTALGLQETDEKKEGAYILSNQFALKGMNNGLDSVPLSAITHFPKLGIKTKVNNKNTAIRQLYIHGTNRESDELGRALSSGCVRIDNIFSFLLANLYKKQGKRLAVFIDVIKLEESKTSKEGLVLKAKTE